MLEALWSVNFESSLGGLGTGIAVLETGRVLGGDTAFTYVGSYTAKPDGMVTAKIAVRKFVNVAVGQSVFGPADMFDLEVAGMAARDQFRLDGHVAGRPELKIAINLVRRAELP